jgi:acyl-CoA synthetase (AMP-forming)/AMP-acid ligase II
VASWLPLSHDMVLFGCALFAWACDAHLVLSTPARFVSDPRTWFGDCAEFGATLSAGPPSALMAAARAQRSSSARSPLTLRTCVIGGEMIAWKVLEAATEAFQPLGLDERVWMPAYGLAEATLVVSATAIDDRPRRALLDRAALTEGEVVTCDDEEQAVSVVSAGRPCGATGVRLRDEGRVSEIRVTSPSLFSGYLGAPELTAERLASGELATGDHGVIRDGELYVVGRADDLLCVAGRNVYVGEIEAAVDRLDHVRSGCATLVDAGEDGRSRLVLVAELRDQGATDMREVARAAARIARAKGGLLLDECVFVPRGTLPKTPSGKIQRFRCQHLVAGDAFELASRVQLRKLSRPQPPSPSRAARL